MIPSLLYFFGTSIIVGYLFWDKRRTKKEQEINRYLQQIENKAGDAYRTVVFGLTGRKDLNLRGGKMRVVHEVAHGPIYLQSELREAQEPSIKLFAQALNVIGGHSETHNPQGDFLYSYGIRSFNIYFIKTKRRFILPSEHLFLYVGWDEPNGSKAEIHGYLFNHAVPTLKYLL